MRCPDWQSPARSSQRQHNGMPELPALPTLYHCCEGFTTLLSPKRLGWSQRPNYSRTVLDFVPVSGPASPTPPPIIRFGEFEVNLHSGELHKQGQKVKLQQQPFQVLVALLQRPGELVSREELRTKLWPADTFVDFDHSLNAAVKRLRDALGDSADAPVFVETLARRGYRFIGSIDGPDAPGETAIVVAPERGHALSSRLWIAAAFVSFIGVGVLVLLARRLPSRPTQIVERKLTTNSSENKVYSAAVSPDGKYLAY